MRRSGKISREWLLPMLYAGIPAVLLAGAVLLWGKEISDLIRVVLKLAVKA